LDFRRQLPNPPANGAGIDSKPSGDVLIAVAVLEVLPHGIGDLLVGCLLGAAWLPGQPPSS
jgi:hypothetical protein